MDKITVPLGASLVTLADGRKFVVDADGRMYQDGNVRVEEYQLTDDELKEIKPDRYVQKYGPDSTMCPFDKCEKLIFLNDGRSVRMHLVAKHSVWYKQYENQLKACENPDQIKALIVETQHAPAS